MLFADLKGSMELLADRDPEEARKLLDPVLERMMEAVHRYEGTVNQVMGDGIMALFGAPVAHEDHAVRACYAALDMQARHAPLRRGGPAHPRRRRCRSASGSTRARSSCAPSAATSAWTTPPSARPPTWPPAWSSSPSPGTTLLTADTLRLAEGYVEVKPLGPVPVKGLADARRGLRAGRARARCARGSRRPPRAGSRASSGATPSWSSSAQALGQRGGRPRPGRGDRRRAGVGQVAARLGGHALPPDARLAHRSRPARSPTARPRPYLPGHRPAQGLLPDRGPRRSPRGSARRSSGKLLTLDDALEPTPPGPPRAPRRAGGRRRSGRRSTRPSAGSARSTPSSASSSARARSSRCCSSSRTSTGSTPRPRRCSTAWSRACRPPGSCSSSTTAPSTSTRWGSKTYYTQLRLDPLPPESAERAAARRCSGDDAGARAAQAAPDRADRGQPVLPRGERPHPGRDRAPGRASAGAYRLATAAAERSRCPPTVQAILAARIDRLPPEDKRLLQTAVGDRQGRAVRPARRPSPSSPRTALRRGPRPPPGRRVPLRDEPVPGPRVHLQARAHPRGGLRQPPPGAAARAPRPDRRGHRAAASATAWPSRSSGSPTTPSAARCGRRRSPTSARPAPRRSARSAYREAARGFEQALAALQHLPGDPRAARAGHRPPRSTLRNALFPLGELETDARPSPRGRDASPTRSATSTGSGGSRPT